MRTLVRYYSRSGNTKVLAEAIAEAAGVKAVSVDSPEAVIKDETDVLFIGGALYAYGLDKHLKAYIEGLDASKVKKAVVFSTSWLSKHSIDLLKNSLKARGIEVADEYFYAKNKPTESQLNDAKAFAKKFI